MKQLAITDPVQVDKRKTEIRAQFKDKLNACVGKRVTDSMMNCVRNAQTADAVVDCLK